MNDGTIHLYDTSSITNGSISRLQCLFSSLKLHMWIFQAAARAPYSPTHPIVQPVSFLLDVRAEAPSQM